MGVEDACRWLGGAETEELVELPASVLSDLAIDDVPEGVGFQVETLKDGVIHLDWNETFRREDARVFGEADHTSTRKFW
ncbi:MAG TPA: hypothetical protein VII49_08355 [Rhizomicrobium sp.]